MTETKSYVNIESCTTVLSADQQPKEEIMLDQQKITIIYCRLSVEDIKEDTKNGKGNFKADESNSIQNQELLCRGWFLPPNTYDCGSFVVNGTAVVGKEPKKAL